jgi:hypothetical protein
MSFWWFALHGGLTGLGVLMVYVASFFAHGLSDTMDMGHKVENRQALLVIALFIGGWALIAWQWLVPMSESTMDGTGPLSSWAGNGYFFLAVVASIIIIAGTVAGELELSYRWGVKRCLANGGHHPQYDPAFIRGTYYKQFCSTCGAPIGTGDVHPWMVR